MVASMCEALLDLEAKIQRGKQAIAQRRAQAQEVPREWTLHLARLERAYQVLTLHSRLEQLHSRLGKGLEVLLLREQGGKTGQPHPLWLQTWEELLRDYKATAQRLASMADCPIGDCRRFEGCTTKPTDCPPVAQGQGA